jgi:methylmalonyl-CoA mutase
MRIDLGIDAFAGRGSPAGIAAGLGLVREAAPTHRLMRVDGWARHNQGLTAAQELGFVLAGMAEILREGVAGGAAITRIASHISARVALGGDMFDAIAKCRAMRRLHAGMLAACGVSRGDMPALYLQGFGGLRMMSVLDAEVNMLRTTTALLGGAIGGADALAGFGHDLLTGETAASMRLVRMTQAMMIAESQLATTLDPAGGAPFIEQRSDDLAAAGWAVFQDIERGGGLLAALADGVIDDLATRAADSREADIRSGQTDLVGVTLQPRGETVPPVQPAFGHLRRPAAPVEALRRTCITAITADFAAAWPG